MDPRVMELINRQARLEADRSVWDSHWKEVAERVLPRQDDFISVRTEGEKRTEKIFDATALLALDRAASAIDSLLTPATQQWHGLHPEDDTLLDNKEVMAYLEQVTKILFRMRYRPQANFASQAHECYISLMAFGTQGMFIDDVVGLGIRYKSIALPELFIAENHVGVVDYVHRKFPLTARQAQQKFGTALPEPIAKWIDKEPFRKFNFLHCVKPNEDVKRGAKDYRGMAFSSYYAAYEEGAREVISEGGYRTMPYQVSRHVTAPRETYGRSPCMMVLPDIKMLNEMEKTIIRAAHKMVDPPLLAFGDGVLSAFNARPNAINYGAVDDQGRQLVHPMKMGSNLPIALDMTEQKRKVINDALYVTLFQILVQNPQMTATEALIRAQEKGQLLAPTVGRQQSEFLGPLIERELDIGAMAGVFPPMPRALVRRGGAIKAVYTSPLSRLRRAEDGVAIMRTLEQVGPIAQVRPDAYDRFDIDALVGELAEINGVPARVLHTLEQMTAIRDERQQQMEAAQAAESGAAAAVAAKNLATAQEKLGTTPTGIPA